MAQDLAILTPEKTVLTYRVAGIGVRMLAHLVDLFLLGGIYAIASFALFYLAAPLGELGEGVAALAVLVGASALPFAYFILFEIFWNGQTPGKKTCRLRVRMANGTGITPAAALTRNFLRPADFLPGTYLLGIVTAFVTPASQRVGDLAAGTIVVIERNMPPRFQPKPYELGVHRFENQIGDLRSMTVEEYVALRRMCDRYPEFSASIQAHMLATVWKPIAQRLHIPEVPGVHPIYLAEATVMKFGREKGLL